MRSWKLIHVLWCILIFGCEDSVSTQGEEEGKEGSGVYLNVAIQLNDRTTYSRGNGELQPDPPEVSGTDEENKIHNLYLFIFDLDKEGGVATGAPQIERLDPQVSEHRVETTVGPKRVYAAANISNDKVEQIQNEKATYTSEEQYYRTVINEFVPYIDGEGNSIEGTTQKGIMMTGCMEESSITLSAGQESKPITINLERVVAKILVTVKAREPKEYDESGVDYAKTYWGENQDVGWMRLDDIYYFPNGTNKQLFYFKQTTDEGKTVVDPNMDLTEYLFSESTDNIYFDNYKDNFVFYDQMTLYKNNASFSRVEKYDAGKVDPPQKEKFYTQGMYCLENTFDIPEQEQKFENYATSMPVVTSVAVAAKFTPRSLCVEKSFPDEMKTFLDQWKKGEAINVPFDQNDVEMWGEIEYLFDNPPGEDYYTITCSKEEEAQYILTRSLKNKGKWCEPDEDYNNGFYPDATYFFEEKSSPSDDVDRPVFYTYGAILDKSGTPSFEFVPYTQGWGYYYTYIDTNGDGMTESSGPIEYSKSQIVRNTYYILIVNGFSKPGNSITSPSTIKVNTKSVEWIYGGRGDIDLH